jgi:N,N'-diacetylchitobiose transport system substrate-binding protein
MRGHRAALLTIGISVLLAGAACGGGNSGKGTEPASGKGRTLTVWLMDGDLTDKTVAAINTQFEQATGATVKVAVQQWDNINTKISTSLAQDNPPDVLDIGNTDVALFAATGGLADITSHRAELSAGQTWLPGLVGPATVDGRLYAAPLFAGNRAVIYNKQVWSAAGITTPPASFAELTADLDQIKAAHPEPDFSAFYLPGQYWYGALQFVWDAGGQIAGKDGGKWAGQLESPAAQRGLQAWKQFQNAYSPAASRDTDNKTPDQAALFAGGKTAAILDSSVNTVLKDNPGMAGQLGTFPFPSATPGRYQPVFLGGSDLAVAAKSRNQDLALAYLKAATDPGVQKSAVAGIDGWTPVSTEIIDQATAALPAISRAFFTAARTSVATPATPGWATIESDKSLRGFFGDIATGRKSTVDAAKSFDAHLDQALNATL